ncbi:hypothetical protein [Myxacorys almedinensis]|uniref:Uncharacterized protein n=1 Tax=Myxacorys almedinensis A TaxID=2690445 RepID=A0A8J8CGL0_9CYAN|nr:hypothetical protein [Myxacorys almedinensis]NDJ15858.1 hypothetical protein [Myxacorys almedinensis A]
MDGADEWAVSLRELGLPSGPSLHLLPSWLFQRAIGLPTRHPTGCISEQNQMGLDHEIKRSNVGQAEHVGELRSRRLADQMQNATPPICQSPDRINPSHTDV